MATKAQYFQTTNRLGDLYQSNGISHSVLLPQNAQIVIAAGQPGSTSTGVPSDPAERMEACLDNCDAALKAAGLKEGLWKAHKMLCFMLDTDQEPMLMEIWRRKWPGHRPTWATVGTSSLCAKGMILEIQAEGHFVLEKGAL